MSFFDSSIPADTEGVKLGASRIRDLKSALNTLISQIWDDTGVFLTNWVTSAALQASTLVDSARAVGANHIKSQSISLRSLISGLFHANGVSRSFFENQMFTTSQLAADAFLTTSGSFVQPAIGSPVAVVVTTDPVAAGLTTGGYASVKFTSSANFAQPSLNGTVIVSVTADPVAAGVVVGARVKSIDGSTVNDYVVTAVLSSPAQVTLQLVTLNGPSVAATTIASATDFYTASRIATIPDGSGVDTYLVTNAISTPTLTVTLTLVSVGGTNTPGTTIATAQPLTSLGAVLSADAAGRLRMAKGFLAIDKFPANLFTADAAGRAPFAAGVITSALLDSATVTTAKAIGYVATGTSSVKVSPNNQLLGCTVSALGTFPTGGWPGYRVTWTTLFADAKYKLSVVPEFTYGSGILAGGVYSTAANIAPDYEVVVGNKTASSVDILYYRSSTQAAVTPDNAVTGTGTTTVTLSAFTIAAS